VSPGASTSEREGTRLASPSHMTFAHSVPATRGRFLLVVALLAAPLASIVSGCSSSVPTSDIHVQSAADEKANLAAYKTFAWSKSDSLVVDRTGVWAEKDFDARQEIEFLVDKALREHGLAVSQGDPDLWVDLSILAEVQDVEEKKAEESKTERRQAVTFDPVGEGALVVELIDAETEKTVWIGGAKGDIRHSRSTEESKQRLSYAVNEMFKSLPH
jgi:uncharacterized protein DUF4136